MRSRRRAQTLTCFPAEIKPRKYVSRIQPAFESVYKISNFIIASFVFDPPARLKAGGKKEKEIVLGENDRMGIWWRGGWFKRVCERR